MKRKCKKGDEGLPRGLLLSGGRDFTLGVYATEDRVYAATKRKMNTQFFSKLRYDSFLPSLCLYHAHTTTSEVQMNEVVVWAPPQAAAFSWLPILAIVFITLACLRVASQCRSADPDCPAPDHQQRTSPFVPCQEEETVAIGGLAVPLRARRQRLDSPRRAPTASSKGGGAPKGEKRNQK